jgi:hypothetical protein
LDNKLYILDDDDDDDDDDDILVSYGGSSGHTLRGKTFVFFSQWRGLHVKRVSVTTTLKKQKNSFPFLVH